MKSYSLWIDKKKQAKIYQKKLVYNKNNKTVLVKTIYSGISKGTEKLVSSKSVSQDQFKLKEPSWKGAFINSNIKYGYINVGNIIDGPKKYINKKIFSLYPHQDLYEISIQNLIFLLEWNQPNH